MHIPFLFYAPALLSPQVHNETVSQIDVLPTVAAMAGQIYKNTTLGRNILDTSVKQHAAFIIYHAPGWIGVINDDYFFRKNIRSQNAELVPVHTNLTASTKMQTDSIRPHLSKLTSASPYTAT